MLNSCTGAFYLVHVAFFTAAAAKLKLYHGLFGAVSGLLITISALVTRLFLLLQQQQSDQHPLIIVGICTTSLLSCLWYSFETHFLLVRKLISSSASSPEGDGAQTVLFIMMSLAYVNVWHVLLLRLKQQPSPSSKWTETDNRLLPRPENETAENHVDFDA